MSYREVRKAAEETNASTCDYAVRLPGRNMDGTPIGPTYTGDTATLCGRPSTVLSRSGRQPNRVIAR